MPHAVSFPLLRFVILPMLRDSESFFKKDCGQAAMTATLIYGDIADVINFS